MHWDCNNIHDLFPILWKWRYATYEVDILITTHIAVERARDKYLDSGQICVIVVCYMFLL